MAQAGEASVEEILESIKKVIARDSSAAADTPRARGNAGISAPRISDAPDTADAVSGDAEAVLELSPFQEEAAEPVEEAAPPEAPLVSEPSRSAMRESLAALAVISEPGAAPQIVRSGETSLEGLVREMLRPMLADWLDKNLPDMVEQLVTREIERIVGKRG